MSETKHVLVSGGSGDIGRAVCLKLSAKGYVPLVGYARNADAANDVVAQTGGQAIALDLADADSIDDAVSQISTEYPTLHGLILAGSPPPVLSPFTKINSEDMSMHWSVNVLGPQRLLAGLIKGVFKPQKAGSVVAVLTKAMGSEQDTAMKQMGAYVIGKYGLLGILKLIEAEYTWLNVASVSPGFTQTKMLNAFDPRFLEMMEAQESFSSPGNVAQDIVNKFLMVKAKQ